MSRKKRVAIAGVAAVVPIAIIVALSHRAVILSYHIARLSNEDAEPWRGNLDANVVLGLPRNHFSPDELRGVAFSSSFEAISQLCKAGDEAALNRVLEAALNTADSNLCLNACILVSRNIEAFLVAGKWDALLLQVEVARCFPHVSHLWTGLLLVLPREVFASTLGQSGLRDLSTEPITREDYRDWAEVHVEKCRAWLIDNWQNLRFDAETDEIKLAQEAVSSRGVVAGEQMRKWEMIKDAWAKFDAASASAKLRTPR